MLNEELKKQEEGEQKARNRAYLDHVMPQVYSLLDKDERTRGKPRNEATELAVIEICNGDPLAVSVEAIRLCLDDPKAVQRLGPSESPASQRLSRIDRIIELLKNTRDAVSLENERKKMLYGGDWTIERLIRREAEIIAAQANAGKTTTELRAETRRPGFQEFEPLPAQYVPPGKIHGVPFSQELLKRLPSPEVTRLLRVYGPDQINEAMRISELKKGAR